MGETRVRRKFLITPRTFRHGDLWETRWLCFADMVERVQQVWIGNDLWLPYLGGAEWVEIDFLDSETIA